MGSSGVVGQTFHLVAPCKCPVSRVIAETQERAWQILFGSDAADMRRTHVLKAVDHRTYEKTPRPFRGRCPHLETQQ